ncbi:MAG TPA: YCF48-related protein [Cytophagaceae bacterium]|jgi:photosystem II stability/assembly factor-like uncharacterized protein|nr:YCF48-related protein [Cytophagaceae bacterium]
MKKGFTILSIFILSGLSGFCRTTAGNTSRDTIIKVPSGIKAYLTSVAFADAFIGIIVGDSGRILKSLDGGKSWRVVHSPTQVWLSAVQFASPKVGFIVGDAGTVLKTINAGESWFKLNTPSTNMLSSISFLDPNNGYIGGGSSRAIYKTRDGGKTWTTISLGDKFSTSIAFADTSTGYVLEQFLWLGRPCWPINKTTDGAKTFTTMSCANMNVTKLKLSSGNIGFAVSTEALYKVIDGNITRIVSTVRGTTDFSFSDASNGFAVGDTIMRTSNGGDSWSVFNATSPRLNAVYSLGKKDAIAVGADGVIVRITTTEQIHTNVLSLFGTVKNETGELKIYPNPFTESFIMNFGKNGNRTIKIYNYLGQELRSMPTDGAAETISMSSLPVGVYYINVHSENGNTTHKIIKE